MKSFKDFKGNMNEAASDWMATVKDKNSNRIEIWVKGHKKAIKSQFGKEAIEDDGLDQVLGEEIYNLLTKAFNTKLKPKEIDDLSPKKIIIQF